MDFLTWLYRFFNPPPRRRPTAHSPPSPPPPDMRPTIPIIGANDPPLDLDPEHAAVNENAAWMVANARRDRERMEALGIKRYQWSTSDDERVCSECHRLDGRIFRWSHPPPHGHPGERLGCRCNALAILDAEDARSMRADARERRLSRSRVRGRPKTCRQQLEERLAR